MNYINIGKTKKVHGTRGDLRLQILEERVEDFMNSDVVFLELNGKQVPFFIAEFTVKGTPMVRFEDINSREEALPLTAKKMFLRQTDLLADDQRTLEVVDDSLKYSRYVGYKIVDITSGEVGLIKEIIEYPQQEMAEVDYKEKEIMIPMNAALIEKIDDKSRMIVMDLPEGMLDL